MKNWQLTVTAVDREVAVQMYRYLQRIFLVKKEDVTKVSDTAFKVLTKKETGEIMVRALKDKFGGQI